MGIAEKLAALGRGLPEGMTLVAVSKTKPDTMILEAYEAGHRDFGENKVQDLAAKAERLPRDIRWHMIGHLQRNKVKYLASFVHLIHGVDSQRLLETIEQEGRKNDRVIDCLLQVHIASEESKFGLSEDELTGILDAPVFRSMQHVRIRGLMGMATYTENREQIRAEFQRLKRIFDSIKASSRPGLEDFDQCSMGMSGDYKIAVEEGSTMVRIGSLIFGLRNY
jgi:pyridoxal phosphate enzyme (YggS family)